MTSPNPYGSTQTEQQLLDRARQFAHDALKCPTVMAILRRLCWEVDSARAARVTVTLH